MSIYYLSPKSLPDDEPMDACRLLRALGATGKLTGFRYAAYMIDRVREDENQLFLITKLLYPETARHFSVRPHTVERGVRTVIKACWRQEDHALLDSIAEKHLEHPPTNSEFLDITAAYLRRRQ